MMKRRTQTLVVFITALFIGSHALCQNTWKFKKTAGQIIGTDAGGKDSFVFKDENSVTVDDGDSITSQTDYAIVSYVGPYITVLQNSSSYMKGAAHDGHERIFAVRDAGTNKNVALTDLFPENDILKALLQDTYIKGALNPGVAPKTLRELTDNLNNTDVARFGDYMFSSFAFHHVEPGKVVVRIGLAYNAEAARGALTQLGFFLPIPENLKPWFAAAVANKTLMKDLMPRIPQIE